MGHTPRPACCLNREAITEIARAPWLGRYRSLKHEAHLKSELGVAVLPVRNVTPPPWANVWHRGTFVKTLLLDVLPLPYDRVIFIDDDCLVLRNIDHLALVPVLHHKAHHVLVAHHVRWRRIEQHSHAHRLVIIGTRERGGGHEAAYNAAREHRNIPSGEVADHDLRIP